MPKQSLVSRRIIVNLSCSLSYIFSHWVSLHEKQSIPETVFSDICWDVWNIYFEITCHFHPSILFSLSLSGSQAGPIPVVIGSDPSLKKTKLKLLYSRARWMPNYCNLNLIDFCSTNTWQEWQKCRHVYKCFGSISWEESNKLQPKDDLAGH